MDGALVRCSSVWLKVLCTSDFALTIICTRLNLIFCDGVHRALGDLAPSSPKDLVVLLGSNGANNALAIMIAASIVKHKTSPGIGVWAQAVRPSSLALWMATNCAGGGRCPDRSSSMMDGGAAG